MLFLNQGRSCSSAHMEWKTHCPFYLVLCSRGLCLWGYSVCEAAISLYFLVRYSFAVCSRSLIEDADGQGRVCYAFCWVRLSVLKFLIALSTSFSSQILVLVNGVFFIPFFFFFSTRGYMLFLSRCDVLKLKVLPHVVVWRIPCCPCLHFSNVIKVAIVPYDFFVGQNKTNQSNQWLLVIVSSPRPWGGSFLWNWK